MPGKPRAITDEKAGRIASMLERGHYLDTTLKLVGVGSTTFYRCVANGRSDIANGEISSADARLVRLLDEAEARGEQNAIDLVRQAGEGWSERKTVTRTIKAPDGVTDVEETVVQEKRDWRAAQWLAERRFSKRWAGNQLVTHDGEIRVKRLLLQDDPALKDGTAKPDTEEHVGEEPAGQPARSPEPGT